MKKIAIFTSSRSDFGLLRRVIELCSYVFDVDLLIAGSHQSAHQQSEQDVLQHVRHLTVRQVAIPFTLEHVTHQAQCLAIAQVQQNLAMHFSQLNYDLFLILGDRWELFGASIPAFLFNIPIAHISGGEITEGVIDDSVRHAHTKLASLHFAANTTYAKNISQMGEEDWRITVSGECGIDSIHQSDIASVAEIQRQYGIDLTQPVILVTCHPSTREFGTTLEDQIHCLLSALDHFPDSHIVFTAPGLEAGSDLIVERIRQFVGTSPQRHYVASFGSRNYLTVLKNAKVVLGNSSSGLVEAASFGVPCVNVGKRQQGRMCAASVLHAGYAVSEITAQLHKALTPEFQKFSRECGNPYDPYRDGRNSDRIVYALQKALEGMPAEKLLSKKLDFTVHENNWNHLLKGYKQ